MMRLSFSHLAVLTHLSAIQQKHEDKPEREVSLLYCDFHINKGKKAVTLT